MAKLAFSVKGTFQAYSKPNARTFMDYKPTELKPQKSQVIGMLGAALGYKVESEEFQQLFDSISVEVKSNEKIPKVYQDYQIVSPKGTSFGTKKLYRTIDKSGNVKYVTALKYYGATERPEDKSNLPTAGGTNPPESKQKIIRKDYLVNSEFDIELTGESETLKKIRKALKHPYYPITLGRRNCIPSHIKVGEIL